MTIKTIPPQPSEMPVPAIQPEIIQPVIPESPVLPTEEPAPIPEEDPPPMEIPSPRETLYLIEQSFRQQ